MPKNKCSKRRKNCQWPELEDKLIAWIEEQRQSSYIMTRNMIRIKALGMTDKLNITGFQASNNWCTRFLARNNLILRQKKKIVQRMPGDLEEKIVDFHRFVLKCRKKDNYELNCQYWQYGLDTCLVRHPIGKNSHHTRRENGLNHHHWPQEVPLRSCPFLPG